MGVPDLDALENDRAFVGEIIAVGILIPLAALDNAFSAWMETTFGVSTGLLLTGSIFALVFAYLVRFMAAALHAVLPKANTVFAC